VSAVETQTPALPEPAEPRGLLDRHRGLIALTGREISRVTKLWQQTIAAPVISSFLFILVFGLSLGSRISGVGGIDYDVFIVPGLVTMAMVQAAYSNNSSSVFQARFDRYINDVLASPMKSWEVNLGLSLGGAVRALIIAVVLVLMALPVVDVPVHDPFALVLAVFLSLVIFSSLGVIVGVYAQSWDHASFVQNIVIVPLSFLGGTFYSVDTLPSPWQEISHVNPLFFVIDAVRYGFLGVSDVSIWLSFAVMAAIAVVMVAWSSWLFATGKKLKA
jgi:ABC-2 type transport system permease protein